MNVLILKKELLERCDDRLPSYLDYSKHSKAGSRFNTPPTFAIYVTGLVCKWLQEEMGGLANISQFNQDKASLLYNVIDQSGGFYSGQRRKGRPLNHERRVHSENRRFRISIPLRRNSGWHDYLERTSKPWRDSSFDL